MGHIGAGKIVQLVKCLPAGRREYLVRSQKHSESPSVLSQAGIPSGGEVETGDRQGSLAGQPGHLLNFKR